MRWQLITSLLAITGAVALPDRLNGRRPQNGPRGVPFDKWTRDGPVEKKFDNYKTKSRSSSAFRFLFLPYFRFA